MEIKHFNFGSNFDIAEENLLFIKNDDEVNAIPLQFQFMLLSGDNFLLLNGDNFLLLK